MFEAKERGAARLTKQVEAALCVTFDYRSRVVLRSHKQLTNIVADAPPGFGSEPALRRYDVIFPKEPVTAGEAIKDVEAREGVDEAYAGNGVLYFSRLTSRATQSYLSRIIMLPVYQSMTIRNWNTTIKLLSLMNARED